MDYLVFVNRVIKLVSYLQKNKGNETYNYNYYKKISDFHKQFENIYREISNKEEIIKEKNYMLLQIFMLKFLNQMIKQHTQ